MKDKYKAVWVSYSSMGDFMKCPRAYYLKNVYKDPKSKRKIAIVTPALALGSAVHNVLEGLQNYPTEERSKQDLFETYENEWKKFLGEKGGFCSIEEEVEYKERGRKMIERAKNNFSLFEEKVVRLKDELPNFYLSEEENIILCGKIDWLKYIPEDDSVYVVDFKTGKNQEDADSIQLPIYSLLLNNCQKRKVSGASYWYLETDDSLTPKDIPDVKESKEKVLSIAIKVKKAREEGKYECPKGSEGCFACRDFEKIIKGEMKYIGVGEYNQDIYITPCTQTLN